MLFVKDLPRMEAFYRDAFGLTPIEATRDPAWVEFGQEGARFSLHAIPAESAEGAEIGEPPSPRESNPAKLSFAVDDFEAAMERLKAAGAQLLQRPWGGVEAVDPEGNVIGLSAG